MSKRTAIAFGWLVLLASLAGCSPAPNKQAQVELQIDGQKLDYQTSKAQVDQQQRGGRYSVYLLPEDPDGKAPYLCLRTYTGNPVAELWVRYTKPERARQQPDKDLDKYECFVPGTLADGRPTLGWAKDDGEERNKTETGQPNCTAEVVHQGERLEVKFQAKLRRGQTGKKKKAGGDDAAKAAEDADTIEVSGKAVVQL